MFVYKLHIQRKQFLKVCFWEAIVSQSSLVCEVEGQQMLGRQVEMMYDGVCPGGVWWKVAGSMDTCDGVPCEHQP